MVFLKIDEKVRTDLNKFLQEHWFSIDIIIRGKIIDMTSAEGIFVYENNTIIGLVTYEILNGECEILSLDSINEKKGIGTDLVQQVIDIARTVNCYKIKLITTNDNINAIKILSKT